MTKERVVIVGAGPAGLTAAYELAKTGEYLITVLEKDDIVGGISRTVDYKGNLIDLGGHRFFSKSDRVLQWWNEILPIRQDQNLRTIGYQNKSKDLPPLKRTEKEFSMLVRPRKSRIYYRKHIFNYPLQLRWNLLRGLGLGKSALITLGILRARIWPIKPETNLEEFYINRFGKELYLTFFKDYTEKVWGKKCQEISNEWGRQRVKSLSIRRIISHSLRNAFEKKQKVRGKTVTSLIEYFLYPAKGPGHMWQTVRERCEEMGVEFYFNAELVKIHREDSRVKGITYAKDNKSSPLPCDYLVSTMPVRSLVDAMEPNLDPRVHDIAGNLEYRDFFIVGLLLKNLKLKDAKNQPIKDNWLYIQDHGVKVGRLQIFNNWSPYMVKDPRHHWIGAEYFCYDSDEIWHKKDQELIDLALKELAQIGVLNKEDYLDGTVIRCPKAYPSYTGSYAHFQEVVHLLKSYKNLFPIGRNGMHKYNNQDHSMLTAFKAVELIEKAHHDKDELWAINTEEEYHEEATRQKK